MRNYSSMGCILFFLQLVPGFKGVNDLLGDVTPFWASGITTYRLF